MPTGGLDTQSYTIEELAEMLKISPAPTVWYSPVSQSVVSASMSEDTGKPKFNVGDVVIGNRFADYEITNTGWRGVVTKVCETGFDAVGFNNEKCGFYSAKDRNCEYYSLSYRCFDLLRRAEDYER